MEGEGEAPAEPKRQRIAIGEWRDGSFLEGSAIALPTKISVMQEHDLPVKNSQNAE